MKSKVQEILPQLTLEEKIEFLTGKGNFESAECKRLNIEKKVFADGPHGVRNVNYSGDATAFPNLCCVGSSWDVELTEKMGAALARDCIHHGVDMILGPGVNIKRNPLCGRNFEYVSEDPVLAGEIGSAYINGVQSQGVSSCVKHYAFNSQERHRGHLNSDLDIRTAMEIYLKAFEIIVKKSAPDSVMCAYNRFHAIWCSENRYLLTEVLREQWGYEGFVVSDWGAVHNASRAFAAGLDLQMPENKNIQAEIKNGLEAGLISESDIDRAVGVVLEFLLKPKAMKQDYNRDAQHAVAREMAAAGCVLLKNVNQALPITKEKYMRVLVIGEYGKSPLTQGHGSAEVFTAEEYKDSPLQELEKILGDEVVVDYYEGFKKATHPEFMFWQMYTQAAEKINQADIVLVFVGAMSASDAESYDRFTASLTPYQEGLIHTACDLGKKTVVINQSGSAMLFGDWESKVAAVVQMWLGGESAGGGIADILCGVVNPSGRLCETFPKQLRKDLTYSYDGRPLEYPERLAAGYRYYDCHPEEICYPFGHGLSYTEFLYENLTVEKVEEAYTVSFDLTNVGNADGAEVVQLYTANPTAEVVRPEKELRAFSKVYLKAGQTKRVTLTVSVRDLGYYHVLLKDYVTESGEYDFLVGASSRDIRLSMSIRHLQRVPYTMVQGGNTETGAII